MAEQFCCTTPVVSVSEEELDKWAAERGVKRRPQERTTEIDEGGNFVRQQNYFTTPFGDKEGELKAEEGRYHLVWAHICHWSNRASIVRELLDLQDVISVTTAGEIGGGIKYSWGFPYSKDFEDPYTGHKFLAEAYAKGDPDFKGRATVPALIDKTTGAVVNNDYHRLTNYFEVNFRSFQPEDAPDLYPEELREEIDKFNAWLYPTINDGHYRMAYARTLEAYNAAFDDFFNALDEIDARLEKNRFLFGDYVTDSDVRVFVSLARFDNHYYRQLGPIKHRVVDYKNVWPYLRDLYEIPAFKNNTYFEDFVKAFGLSKGAGGNFGSFTNKFGLKIDYDKLWSEPQNRKVLSKTPEEKFLRHRH